MKYKNIEGKNCSVIIQGCMRIGALDDSEVDSLIKSDLENGINFFDHADIYGKGVCEEKFGKVLKEQPSIREKMIIQTKCGIRKGYYDSSYEHILKSAEESLKRLNCEYLDFLLIHRPDALCDPEETAAAIEKLRSEGKVRAFGVSNHNPSQIKLLSKYLSCKTAINQLQLSITEASMIESGLFVNTSFPQAADRDGGVLDFCRLENITIQAWSPFQYGFIEGCFIGNDKFPQLNSALNELSEKYGVSPSAVASAWILIHPAKMQVIVGSADKEHVKQACDSSEITLSREDWYYLYRSAGRRVI